jgi:hypothetical protein
MLSSTLYLFPHHNFYFILKSFEGPYVGALGNFVCMEDCSLGMELILSSACFSFFQVRAYAHFFSLCEQGNLPNFYVFSPPMKGLLELSYFGSSSYQTYQISFTSFWQIFDIARKIIFP